MRTPAFDFSARRAHRLLRAAVFTRDDFKCVICQAGPPLVQRPYDGRYAPIWDEAIPAHWPPRRRRDLFDRWRRTLHIDHIVPRVVGGGQDITNLQTLCDSCNARKATQDRRAVAA